MTVKISSNQRGFSYAVSVAITPTPTRIRPRMAFAPRAPNLLLVTRRKVALMAVGPALSPPDCHDRLSHTGKKATVQDPREREHKLVPKTQLRFSPHGMPPQ